MKKKQWSRDLTLKSSRGGAGLKVLPLLHCTGDQRSILKGESFWEGFKALCHSHFGMNRPRQMDSLCVPEMGFECIAVCLVYIHMCTCIYMCNLFIQYVNIVMWEKREFKV